VARGGIGRGIGARLGRARLGARPRPVAAVGGREGLDGELLLDARGGRLDLDAGRPQRLDHVLALKAALLGDLVDALLHAVESSAAASDSAEPSAPTGAVSSARCGSPPPSAPSLQA